MENAIPVEIERKYLIRLPEEELLLRLAVRRDAIEQTYLRSRTKDTTERVRLRGGVYTHTIKRRAGAYSHEEQEEVIDEAACRALLERADPALQTIRKTRWCIPYEGRMLELDVFPFWRSQAMLEIELRDEAEQPTLPPWVTLLREVSGDRRYSNRAMAAEPPKEDGSLRQSPIARTWAEVRLDRIEQNYRALSAALPEG